MNVQYQGTRSKSNLHHRVGNYGGLGRVLGIVYRFVLNYFLRWCWGYGLEGELVLTYGVGCRGGGRLLWVCCARVVGGIEDFASNYHI